MKFLTLITIRDELHSNSLANFILTASLAPTVVVSAVTTGARLVITAVTEVRGVTALKAPLTRVRLSSPSAAPVTVRAAVPSTGILVKKLFDRDRCIFPHRIRLRFFSYFCSALKNPNECSTAGLNQNSSWNNNTMILDFHKLPLCTFHIHFLYKRRSSVADP
jgi:hypothetical protein